MNVSHEKHNRCNVWDHSSVPGTSVLIFSKFLGLIPAYDDIAFVKLWKNTKNYYECACCVSKYIQLSGSDMS